MAIQTFRSRRRTQTNRQQRGHHKRRCFFEQLEKREMLSAAPWQDFADSSDSETDSNASPSQTSDNVAPAFNKTDTDPEVVFEVDAVGVPRNVSVAGTFWDPDESDQHQLSIEWADGVMEAKIRSTSLSEIVHSMLFGRLISAG